MARGAEFPAPEGAAGPAVWDGRAFVTGGIRAPVLEYNENFSGWSDGLTGLHEDLDDGSYPLNAESRRLAVEMVRRFMPGPGAVIMDIGCSSGLLLKDLIRAFPDADIMGADVVREPLFRLAERMPGIPLLRFDLTRCPLPGRSVDVIVMLNVLEHIEDDVLALKKAFGLLRPGGALVIEVPAGPGLYDDYDRELRHFRRYSAGELRRKLEEAGFSVARRSHLGFLLFPFFAAVKLFGIWRSGGGKDGGDAVVRARVARTTDSSLMRLAVYLESKFLSRFSLPFGIRTLAVARRPGGAGGGDL